MDSLFSGDGLLMCDVNTQLGHHEHSGVLIGLAFELFIYNKLT